MSAPPAAPAPAPEKSLRGATIDAAIAAAVPRNPRRFHFEMIRIRVPLGVSLTSYGGNTIDFHQRISRQCIDCNRFAGWAALREGRREYLVHSLPVFNLHNKHIG